MGLWIKRFPGTSGDYASAPDDAAFSALTDFSVLFLGSLDDWTPASQNVLAAHWGGAGLRSWLFAVQGTAATNQLRLQVSTDGTASASGQVANPGFSDGTVHWLLVTRASSSGDVKFYQADYVPGSVAPPAIGSFSQVGSTVTTTTGTLFNSTASLEVGSDIAGTNPLDGDCYRTLLYTGIYGSGSETLVRDFNPNDGATSDDTSWVASTTGETWTVNGGDVLGHMYAFPTAATGTGAASAPSPSIKPTGGLASATGAASSPASSIKPTGGLASGAGAASAPASSIKPTSGVATGTGAAGTAGVSITGGSGTATGTGSGSAPAPSLAPTAGGASGTGTAYDATVSTTSDRNANAGLASGTGAANNASVSIAVNTGIATGTGAAYDATATGGSVTPPETPAQGGHGRPANARAHAMAQARHARLRREEDEILLLV